MAAGMALAAKRDGKKHRVFSVAGDGECNEGSVWEAAQFANHYRLSNYTLIIDHNKMQSLGCCDDALEVVGLADKWRSFGWEAEEVDGHDNEKLKQALSVPGKEKPKVVVAHTIKGKGVSFMENEVLWHYRDPQGEFYEKAVKELEDAKE